MSQNIQNMYELKNKDFMIFPEGIYGFWPLTIRTSEQREKMGEF